MHIDRQLLEQYAHGSREALDVLVRRYVDLVYSAALRQVRDRHLAEDITQAVFLILAKKAGSIREGAAAGGWLLAVTRRTAVNAMHKRRVDRRHDEAVARPEWVEAQASAEWEQIAPVLDEALAGLGRADRDAIVLRVLENKSLAQMGAVLGISEFGASKRLTRALERLRKVLVGRGVSVPGAGLAALLAVEAVKPAPAAVVAGAVTAASTGTAGPAVLALVKAGLAVVKAGAVKLVVAVVLMLGTLLVVSDTLLNRSRATAAIATGATVMPPAGQAPSHFEGMGDVDAYGFRTEDRLALPSISNEPDLAMTQDALGNVYLAVPMLGASGRNGRVLREKGDGGDRWESLFDGPTALRAVAAGSNGDLYAAAVSKDVWRVYRRARGQSGNAERRADTELPGVFDTSFNASSAN